MNMNDLIEQLALLKSFGELSQTERVAVLEEMSPEHYEQLRAVLLAAPSLDAGPLPSSALRARLLHRMSAKTQPSVLSRKVPVWQAAAALALAVAVVWMLKVPVVREVEVAAPVAQTRTDKIYKEKIVWKERWTVREKVVYRDRPVVPEIAQAVLPVPSGTPEPVDFPPEDLSVPPTGTSLGNEPALMDFFVQIK